MKEILNSRYVTYILTIRYLYKDEYNIYLDACFYHIDLVG